MVYVTHNSDDRCSRLEIFFLVLEIFDSLFLSFLLHSAYRDLYTHFLCEENYGVFVEVLVDVRHHAHLHQRTDQHSGNHYRARSP